MREIKLQKLKIVNFKGVKELVLNGNEINIFGANETRKTTIIDAYNYGLFGKDHLGNQKFNIKPLDSNNKQINNSENEVEITYIIGGTAKLKLRRVQEEDWTKKRGTDQTIFKGNNIKYYIDDLNVKKSEYDAKINELFTEEKFKILTNPLYFNSKNFDKDKRRDIIFSLAGDFNKLDIVKGDKELEDLINSGKNLDDELTRAKQEITLLKKQLADIPARIDEKERGMPEKHPMDEINAKIKEFEDEIEKIESKIEDNNKEYNEVQQKNGEVRQKIIELESKKSQIRQEIILKASSTTNEKENKLQQIKNQISKVENIEISSLKSRLNEIDNDIENLIKKVELKRKEFENTQSQEFSSDKLTDGKFICPVTKQECKDTNTTNSIIGNQEKLKVEFNDEKIKKLEKIKKEAQDFKDKIEDLKTKKEEISKDVEKRQEELKNLKELKEQKQEEIENVKANTDTDTDKLIENDGEYKEVCKLIEENQKKIVTFEMPDNSNLKEQKQALKTDMQFYRDEKKNQENRIESLQRIEELKEEQKKINSEISKYENIEMLVERYKHKKVDFLQDKIDSKFQYVKWRMYEPQINGGYREDCTCLISGVPFYDANNAAKINAGIDIINTLSREYNIKAPVFIDNCESVNKVLDNELQMFRFFVIEEPPKDLAEKKKYYDYYIKKGKLLTK